MHTLFVREHNRLAEALRDVDEVDDKAVDTGLTTDEYIYQVVRKIVSFTLTTPTFHIRSSPR
jgi:hypothetical protein